LNALPETRATLWSLHQALLTADSATSVLESFFGTVSVIRLDQPPSINEGLEERLRLAPGDDLRHRVVRLMAGEKLVSEAELWFVANRLPAERVQRLESSDTPFGRIMRPLGLKRVVLMARICRPGEAGALLHRALLAAPGGVPVAEVFELYASGLFEDP
jgi:chorismate-pyruvate lyase